MPFLRRLSFAPIVFLVVAATTYAMPRVLRPELFPGEQFFPGLAGDLERALLHLDFGCAVRIAGCPSIHDLWVRGLWWDLWLLCGAIVIGTAGGILAGVWCARRPRSLRSRALESAAQDGALKPWRGETTIFIQPPYEFRAVDGLITNFHLPRTTLLLLVAAFAGVDVTKAAYEEAIRERYRFYSYGDAMFIR